MISLEKYMFPCLSKKLFGVACLGCGMQRALVLLCQGRFVAAFEMYPAIYTSLLFFATLFLYFFDGKRDYKKAMQISGMINGIFMIGGYCYHYL